MLIVGCGSENSDGSLKSTYSSCKITKSSALFAEDRVKDLQQCWNATGDGYGEENKADAMSWCRGLVDSYIAEEYIVGHSVEYALESAYCKSEP